ACSAQVSQRGSFCLEIMSVRSGVENGNSVNSLPGGTTRTKGQFKKNASINGEPELRMLKICFLEGSSRMSEDHAGFDPHVPWKSGFSNADLRLESQREKTGS
ncbi:Protein of unknown function, partial [Gryllus bimaculatus]